MITISRQLDDKAFHVILAHLTMIKAFVSFMIHDYHLANEVTSEAFAKLVQVWPSYDPTRPFGPWARTVVRRVALAALQERGQREICSEAQLERLALQYDEVEDESVLEERKAALLGCVQRLPPHYSNLIHKFYWEQWSYPQLSELLGRSVASLYVTFHRVHKILFVCITTQSNGL